MGFLDDLKSKLPFGQNQGGYGQDDYAQDGYEDYYDDGAGADYPSESYGAGTSDYYNSEPTNGVLGQTRRGEAESVAVYTRSGQLVGDAARHATTYNPPARSQEGSHVAGAPADSDEAASPSTAPTVSMPTVGTSSEPAPLTPATAARVSAIANNNPQLPAFILRPESYDDVETVVRRVRTRQPVALVFVGVRTEIAKRVLDFSYGFVCGSGDTVKELGDRVFMVLPKGCEVQASDLKKLREEGYLKESNQ